MTSSSSSLTTIERLTLWESDPGFATSTTPTAHAPARAGVRDAAPEVRDPSPGRDPIAVPWCVRCQLHGHSTVRCPKGEGLPALRVRDEHELERLLVGSGWDEIR